MCSKSIQSFEKLTYCFSDCWLCLDNVTVNVYKKYKDRNRIRRGPFEQSNHEDYNGQADLMKIRVDDILDQCLLI